MLGQNATTSMVRREVQVVFMPLQQKEKRPPPLLLVHSSGVGIRMFLLLARWAPAGGGISTTNTTAAVLHMDSDEGAQSPGEESSDSSQGTDSWNMTL